MKAMRPFAAAVLVVVALAVTSSCGEAPTTPPPPEPLLGGLLQQTGLLQCSPLPYASTTAIIGPEGGTINVGPHSLRIPAGALEEPVTITATAPTGRVNVVDLQPEGLQFERPASLTMSYANCNLLGSLAPKRIAYTDDALVILEYLLSIDNLLQKKVTGRLEHFSHYAVAW